jgi:pimeloyl-ACP methyl ester carboxylesterase
VSNYTHETVPTKFIEAKGIRYADRRFGKAGKVPLLFLEYFNSNMDGWDPAVTNSLAADHEIILFDNAGVGASGGETPYTVMEMTQHCIAFCRAVGLNAIHIVGFSLGGMIAQQLALEQPDLVRRLILVGTGPRGGEGMTFTELSSEEQADQELGGRTACGDPRMGNHTINRSLRYLKEHYTSHTCRSRQQRYRGCAGQRPAPGGAPAKCSVDRVPRFES